MTKHIEFEDRLSDLITETFETKAQLQEAIEYFDDTTMAQLLKDAMQFYEEE